MNIVFTHDGTYDGVMTAALAALRAEQSPCAVLREDAQRELFKSYVFFASDPDASAKLLEYVQKRISEAACHIISIVALSSLEDSGTVILEYLREMRSQKRKNDFAYGNSAILRAWQIRDNVMREYHRFLGFLRFSAEKKGILVAEICPKNDIVMLLAEHFADRMKNERWIIYDTGRKKAAVYDSNIYREVNAELRHNLNRDEICFEELWKSFLFNVTIEERRNPALQRNNMPLRYRKFMTEFREL